MSYQHKVEKFLRRELSNEVLVGQWIEFQDSNGFGYAQPDVFLPGPYSTLVFESKLKETLSGHEQIEHLYRPLLRHIFARPVVGILVTRTIIQSPAHLIQHPGELLDETKELTHVWHWLG